MKLNPIEEKIIQLIKEDMNKTNSDHSKITNSEISKTLGISPFSIRDHVLKLAKKGAIIKRNDFWTPDMKYHQRVIYLK